MSTFEAHRRGRVLHLSFGAPDQHNLMSDVWFGDLDEALNAASEDPDIRAICLSAEGKTFCSGGDLKGFLEGPWPEGAMRSKFARCLERFEVFDKPLVAAVHGAAVGGGATLLLHFDFVYAEPDTSFQFPFTNIGVVPELGSSYLLPLFAGQRLAADLLLLGRPFDAATALKAGLVNDLVPLSELLPKAMETAEALAALPPASLRATKLLLKSARRGGYAEAWRAECFSLEKCFGGEELREAAQAFLEKRKPDFSRFQ